MTDFKHISDEARERLVAELHRSVANVSAAVDEAAGSVLDAAEADARQAAELAAARVEHLAADGLEPLRKLSAALLDRATELDREIGRLASLADEAAEALRARVPDVDAPLAEPAEDPEPAPAPDPLAERFELPPILPSLAPDSPLDRLEEHRRAIAEHPLDFPPRRRFDDPADRPVDVRPGVRLIVEQLRLIGEPDPAIAERLEQMGVDDPEAVLAQVY